MRIRINKRISVRVEKNQYVVERHGRSKDKNTGEWLDRWEDERWYTNLDPLIQFLIREKFSQSDEELMMSEFLRRYRKEFTEFKRMLVA